MGTFGDLFKTNMSNIKYRKNNVCIPIHSLLHIQINKQFIQEVSKPLSVIRSKWKLIFSHKICDTILYNWKEIAMLQSKN